MKTVLYERISSLGQNEKRLLFFGVGALALALFWGFFFKPSAAQARRYRAKIVRIDEQLRSLEGQLPQARASRQEHKALREEMQELGRDIVALEEDLPGQKLSGQLTEALIQRAKNVDLTSLRQKTEGGDEYSRITAELQISGTFSAIVGYVKKVQSISSYLSIDSLEIVESEKKSAANQTTARMVLSSLLGHEALVRPLATSAGEEGAVAFRDIFTARTKPVPLPSQTDFKLEGITFSSEDATSIINGELLTEGSALNGYNVKRILPDMVVLTDGYHDLELRMEH